MGHTGLLLRTAAAPAMWGTTYLVTTELLPVDHPMWNGLLRALPAGLLVLALRPGRPTGSWWWRSLLLGSLNIGGFFALLFVAAHLLPGGVAATLGATQALLVVGLAAALLGERPSRAQIGTALAGVLGVALLVLQGTAALNPLGVLAGLGTAVLIAFGMVLTRRWGLPTDAAGRPVHGLTATAWQLLGGSIVLLVLALGIEGAPPHIGWSSVAGYAWLSVFGGALAYVLYFAGVRNLPAAASSLLGLVSPLVATLLGWAVLGQSLTPVQLVGAALVLASVVVGQRLAVRRPVQVTPAGDPVAVRTPSTPHR
ncbi:EamA family transporter [Solihabitans fulvus]|uniref:EamA family transporter n=1 Tax=Solihabitans fulvus TaxID=1892852 RepID=A0A5B2XEG1_9PSEU|nr:EamA family transporter [Solihabitans fulvus]KAA2262168.1 EamA family transporter [Solihabitans fulvus]